MKRTWAVSVAAVLLMAGSAWAVPIDSFFDVWINGYNEYLGGDPAMNNGYNDGTFYYYPQTGWWNEWYFNDPEILDRWKRIDYAITVDNRVPSPDVIQIVVNWSEPAWGDPAMPPLPEVAGADGFINRTALIYTGPVMGPMTFADTIIIDQYNPIWVSIDVRALGDSTGQSEFHVYGTIVHECLPEPATLGLLAVGGGLALLRRRR